MDSPEYWPLPGLRLRTGRLELRLPDAADLTALAALAEAGVHDRDVQPLAVAWTDVEPAGWNGAADDTRRTARAASPAARPGVLAGAPDNRGDNLRS